MAASGSSRSAEGRGGVAAIRLHGSSSNLDRSTKIALDDPAGRKPRPTCEPG